MSRRRRRAGSCRVALASLLACVIVAAVPAGVGAQETSGSPDAIPEIEARITAQRHDNDHVEFALQLRVDGEEWSDRILPRLRFFPPDTEIGRWLVSSVLVVRQQEDLGESLPAAEVEVRITAQRLANERIEFGLEQRPPDESWSERRLPARRFFPMATEVGRWLFSSPLDVHLTALPTETEPADTEDDGDDEPVNEPDRNDEPSAADVSDDLLDFEMIDVQSGQAVNIRSVVDGETPLLFWLWSPY